MRMNTQRSDPDHDGLHLDWLQSLKHFSINVPDHILVASLTLMALLNRAIRVRLATSI